MNYIVTGGLGFIGSNLVDELIGRGHEVLIYDDLSTGKIEHLNPKASLIQCKIEEIKQWVNDNNIEGYLFLFSAQFNFNAQEIFAYFGWYVIFVNLVLGFAGKIRAKKPAGGIRVFVLF